MCGCVGRVRWASVMGKENGKVAVRATAGAAAMEKAMSSGKGGREGDGQGEKNSVGEEMTVRATARAAATATAMRGRRAGREVCVCEDRGWCQGRWPQSSPC